MNRAQARSKAVRPTAREFSGNSEAPELNYEGIRSPGMWSALLDSRGITLEFRAVMEDTIW